MPTLDLMLGTRRLRRKIEQQAQQLHCDIEREQVARTQFRQTFIARMTSPLGLLSAAGAGFVVAKIGGRSSHVNRAAADTVSSATTLTFTAIRSAAIQVVLPMVIEWMRSKFADHNNNEEASTDAQTQTDKLPGDQV